MADVRPCAHTTPTRRRLVAGYVGPASGLRTALLSGAAIRTQPAGGSR
ncbi:hypothetical protein [Micromonospora sp. NPDC050200]